MTYLIAFIVILLIIVLFLLFYSPKYKPEQELEQHEGILDELTASQPSEPVESTALPEIEEIPEPEADIVDKGAELSLDESEPEAVIDDHEFELTFDEVVEEVEGPELDFAPPDESSVAPVGEHEFELNLDEETDDIESPAEEPAPGLMFDEPSEVAEEKPELIEPEEIGDIPFIDEGDEPQAQEADEEVSPALSGFGEDETSLDHEETPDDLAERLDFFFGSEDGEQQVPEADEESDGSEAAVAEPEAEPEIEEEPEEEVPVVEPELTLEQYGTGLRELEKRLRDDLDKAIVDRETASLDLLEMGLTQVCGMQVDMAESLAKQQSLITDTENILEIIQEELPGFQSDVIRQNLHGGDAEVVQSLLAEASSQLDNAPELAARIKFISGRLAQEQAEFASAFELYKAACENDGENGDYLYAAGHMARILGNDEEAQQWLGKLVDDDQEENVNLALAQHELARVFARGGQKDQVEPLLKKALETMEKQFGTDDPALGEVAHDLAALYESTGMYEQAEPLYKRALEVKEKALGSEHPNLGATLNKLAGLYEEMELEEQAEPLYAKALDIKKRVLGENHPDVGSILNNLANLLKLQGKYDQSEPMFLQSLDIAEKALGKDHPNLAVVLNNIAELYSEMGKEEEAEHFQERAFSLFELPGGGGDFVEMEKDHEINIDDEKDKSIT